MDHAQRRRRRSPRSAPRPARARSSSSCAAPRAAASPRCRWARRCASSCELAGGTGGRALKAVLVGGPTGGLLPPDLLDTPYEFDALREAGAHIGSGSVVIADERACIVDLARLLTRFSADEACGKSIPCRIGLRRLYEIGDRDRERHARSPPTRPCWRTSRTTSRPSALCDHERLATLPFTSGMRYFRSELDDHLLRSTCPAGVCTPIAVGAGATAAGSR